MIAPRAAALWLTLVGLSGPALAELSTVDAPFTLANVANGTIPPVTANARLDFSLSIEKMLFLRIGTGAGHGGARSGAGPAANGSVDTVTLDLVPRIQAGNVTPVEGNNQAITWNSVAPRGSVSARVGVPIEVRSNAGPVRISGQVTSPLANGATSLPMSRISISSSSAANLPAPAVPDAGPGVPVDIATGGPGTGAAPALLTARTATWFFRLNAGAVPTAGSYTGTVTFTATSL